MAFYWFWCEIYCNTVVNALLLKGFSNTYLSRYNSVSLSNQWLNPDTISSAINQPGHKLLIDQRQSNGLDQLSKSLHGHRHFIDQCQTNRHYQLSMSTLTLSLNRSIENGHDRLLTFLGMSKCIAMWSGTVFIKIQSG